MRERMRERMREPSGRYGRPATEGQLEERPELRPATPRDPELRPATPRDPEPRPATPRDPELRPATPRPAAPRDPDQKPPSLAYLDTAPPEHEPLHDPERLSTRMHRFVTRAATAAGAIVTVAAIAAVVNFSNIGPTGAPKFAAAMSGATDGPHAAAPPLSSPTQSADPNAANEPHAAQRSRVDPRWAEKTATSAGIPLRAFTAYANAAIILAEESPECALGWNTLAAIGNIESGHGSFGGAALDAQGYPNPAIRGLPLNGDGVAAIRDTDGGIWDGDAVWDRAVGPMQFIPSTWETWGADGNGDARADPNQIDDATLGAGRYLCHGGSMANVAGWRAAIFSYNHLDEYVDSVAVSANVYADAAKGVS